MPSWATATNKCRMHSLYRRCRPADTTEGGHSSSGVQGPYAPLSACCPPPPPPECRSCHQTGLSRRLSPPLLRTECHGARGDPPSYTCSSPRWPRIPRMFCSSVVFLPESCALGTGTCRGVQRRQPALQGQLGFSLLLHSHRRAGENDRETPSICGLHP